MLNFLNSLNQYAALVNLVLLLAMIGVIITLAKWQNDVLKARLDKALSESPLAITEDLKKRYELTEEEYKRLKQDMGEKIQYLEKKLDEGVKVEFVELSAEQIAEIPFIVKTVDSGVDSGEAVVVGLGVVQD